VSGEAELVHAWDGWCNYGIAENTLYRWKSKYGGMEVSEAKRLRELQAENRRLKHLLGEAELDKAAMKEIIEGKW
jgi:putative transposase